MADQYTHASDLIIPEVWGAEIGLKVPGKAVMRPFVTLDTTLQGNPGDTISFPSWAYIGDADDLDEDDVIELRKLTQTSKSIGIKEAGTGIGITDRSILYGMGDPQGQATTQLALSVARKIDADIIAAATHTHTNGGAGDTEPTTSPLSLTVKGPMTYDSIVDATALLGEDYDMSEVLGVVIHSKQYTQLRKDDDFLSADKVGAGNTAIQTGRVGNVAGLDIVITDRMPAVTDVDSGTTGDQAGHVALLILRDAITLAYKRQAIVEKARDIQARKTLVTTNVHYGVTRTNDNGVIVINYED